VLLINTTSIVHNETISLEGIPGDALFALNTSDTATQVAALNGVAGSLFNKVDLPDYWKNLFEQTASIPQRHARLWRRGDTRRRYRHHRQRQQRVD